MYLLAIDASTKATGIAIFENNKLMTYQCIQCDQPDVLDRIYYMKTQISKIYQTFHPDFIVMQDVLPEQVGHNQNVYKALIYLQALLVTTFHAYGKQVKLMTASHWRKLCGFKLGAGVTRTKLKQMSMNLVEGIYKIEVNDDISDAICLGIAELQQRNSK